MHNFIATYFRIRGRRTIQRRVEFFAPDFETAEDYAIARERKGETAFVEAA